MRAASAAAPVESGGGAAPHTPTRVACVGDSITFGSHTRIPELESYPAQLQRMLDPARWTVGNFGVSGATLLNHGDKPYQKQRAFADAIAFQAEIVVIMLGTNDSKPQNWRYQSEFAADYRDLIAKFKAGAPSCRIFVCLPPLVTGDGAYGIKEAPIEAELPWIRTVAKDEGADLIDMHAVLVGHEELLDDHVHPKTEGATLLARAAYRALAGHEFTGSLAPSLRVEWMGYDRILFASNDRLGSLVLPRTAAAGCPWIWRTEFFGNEPYADLALLERGWHVAYVDVRNLYGAPVALDAMDAFYARVVADWKLAPKVTLEGFSRGGLFAFNWAVRHPERVASIYGDAPVLDFKSWPGGKGKGPGSAADWQRCLAVYGLTEPQALEYRGNPIDNLAPLARAHIPIICVCGDADKTVPFEENTKLAKERYDALGGTMEVIVKHGADHHPHSLKDPKPIVDFLVQHTARK